MTEDTAVSQAYIRPWRQYRALSQGELAERAGLTREAVNRAENQRNGLRPSTIRKLAQALGIKPHQLLKQPLEDSR